MRKPKGPTLRIVFGLDPGKDKPHAQTLNPWPVVDAAKALGIWVKSVERSSIVFDVALSDTPIIKKLAQAQGWDFRPQEPQPEYVTSKTSNRKD
jgi:hypothetical protein